jgi:hypothetical protein
MSPTGFVSLAALVLWFPVTLALFLLLPPKRAVLFAVFGAVLFLPEGAWLKIPLLPPLDKETVPFLGILLAASIRSPGRIWRLPRERWVTVMTLAMLAGGIATALTNADSLLVGAWRIVALPPLTIKDGMSIALDEVFGAAIPFFVGAAFMRNPEDLEDLLVFLAGAGLLYSVFALLELRLSPRLHAWVYGYQQTDDFAQAIRFGGYRPMVFMAHGLALSLFFTVTALAATAVRTVRGRVWRFATGRVSLYLDVIVLACKSLAAILYAACAVPLAAFASAKWQQRVAAVVLIYPVLRGADLFPTSAVVSVGKKFGIDRARSMEFRFNNEDQLLAKARQRPWFGWGKFNRNAVIDAGGHPVSVTDGQWIIAFGVSGATGFVTEFGLLLLPVFLTGRRLRRVEDRTQRRLIASLSLIVAVTAADLIPNSRFSSYPYFLAGALLSLSAAWQKSRPGQWPDRNFVTNTNANVFNPIA